MGNISMFDLNYARKKYGLDTFVETGMGQGKGIKHALSRGMRKVLSCDIDKSCYTRETRRWRKYPEVELYLGESTDFLRKVLPTIDKAIFWLDAHFPGSVGSNKGDFTQRGCSSDSHLPLEAELRAIKEAPCCSQSIIYMDDLRIYMDGHFQSGSWEDRKRNGAESAEFVDELLSDTHTLCRIFADQGYIIALPRAI